MKRTLNLLAETLAFPFSYEVIRNDPLILCAEEKKICDQTISTGSRIAALEKGLDQAAFPVARILNQSIDIPNITLLQGMIHYLFRGKTIVSYAEQHACFKDPRAVFQYFYLQQITEIARMLITTRNGYAVLRPWNGLPKDDLFRTHDGFRPLSSQDDVSFSPVRIELWNSILRCIPEDLLISCYAASKAQKDVNSGTRETMVWKMLHSFGEHVQIADALLDGILIKGMAETHLHAGASRTFGIIWENMLANAICNEKMLEKDVYHLPYKEDIEEKKLKEIGLEAAVTRAFLAKYLASGYAQTDVFLEKSFLSYRYQYLFEKGTAEILEKGYPSSPFSSVYHPDEPFWGDTYSKNQLSLWKLLDLPAPRGMVTSEATFIERYFLTQSILHIERYPDDLKFTALFTYYLRHRNHAYRMRVEDGKSKGLSYFQKFYDLSTDRGGTNRAENIRSLLFTSMLDPRIKKTEFRFSPPTVKAYRKKDAIEEAKQRIKQDIICFIREYIFMLVLKYSEENKRKKLSKEEFDVLFETRWENILEGIRDKRNGELARLLKLFDVQIKDIPAYRPGIIYHMIKWGEEKERDSCFAKEGLTERENEALFSFGDARFTYDAAVEALSDLRNKCPGIGRLIVGIDAASLEISTDPWVFVPAFQKARHLNACWGTGESEKNRKPLLGLTYHVGEDFRHPISGLRHIDEAFSGLGMRAGDRIGHGLALGLNLEHWFSQYGMAVVPRIEWLENNLWLWHLITTEQQMIGISKYAQMIEKQIFEDTRAIYGTMDGITIEGLYQAYASKTKDTREIQKITNRVRQKYDAHTDCFQASGKECFFPCYKKDKGEYQAWRENMLILSYHCNYLKQRMNESILITSTPDQLEIAKCAQQYLQDKIATNGVIIETNPSSNTTIGEIEGVLLHPVFQMRGEKGKRIMTTVNTDDPSVFNATVPNELAQIYYTLRYHGKTAEEALEEVDIMRETAMRTSFIGEERSAEETLEDYEKILVYLCRS